MKEAEVSADARHCRDVLEHFTLITSTSKVVIARSLNLIFELVNSDTQLYVSYYRQLQSGARLPEQNEWDKGRTAADSTVSPHYYDDLVYGALSATGRGVKSFGPYSIVLKEDMVKLRSTVFEENSFVFCRRHRVSAGQGAPLGYRAVWSERQLLAKAKLCSKLSEASKVADFPDILLAAPHEGVEGDFIEVHIYGAIHRSAIERIVGPKPAGGPALVLWRATESKLKQIGAVMEAG